MYKIHWADLYQHLKCTHTILETLSTKKEPTLHMICSVEQDSLRN